MQISKDTVMLLAVEGDKSALRALQTCKARTENKPWISEMIAYKVEFNMCPITREIQLWIDGTFP